MTPVSSTFAWKSPNEPNLASIASPQRAAGLAAAVRAHRLPEQRVVVVAAAVVADGAALRLRHLAQDRRGRPRSACRRARPLQRGVRLVDVRLVVLVVMEAHRVRVDVRLERLVGVGERRDFVGHAGLLDRVPGFIKRPPSRDRGPTADGSMGRCGFCCELTSVCEVNSQRIRMRRSRGTAAAGAPESERPRRARRTASVKGGGARTGVAALLRVDLGERGQVHNAIAAGGGEARGPPPRLRPPSMPQLAGARGVRPSPSRPRRGSANGAVKEPGAQTGAAASVAS